MILSSEEPEEAWKYFFQNADYIDSSDEKEVEAFFTAQQIQKYDKEYCELIEALLNKLVIQRCEKEEFYNELWKKIIKSNIICDGENEKIYAIAKIWADARIPYFHIGEGIRMSDEEFSEIIDKNKELLQEVTFILNCKYEQRTETSSVLLDVLERCDGIREKSVVMAKILDLVEKKVFYSILKKN